MGICKFCGKDAGWFKEQHAECAQLAETGYQQILAAVRQAVAQGTSFAEAKTSIDIAIMLDRVPADRVMQREAYEFFVNLTPDNQPIWSHDIAQRGPVFQNPHACYRTGISYDAPIKRYLWWQGAQTDGRFKGGFTLYDAPEPWGPWTTAFYTEDWDIGPGESSSFPTKWISADGKTLHLVFSGEDSFSVREAKLTLH